MVCGANGRYIGLISDDVVKASDGRTWCDRTWFDHARSPFTRNGGLHKESVVSISLTRRGVTALLGSLAVAGAMFTPMITLADTEGAGLEAELASLEQRLDARLGVAVTDTGSGRHWGHREDERFPMASTFKVLACAALLDRVDAGQEELQRRVIYEQDDLVTYSPVTKEHVGEPGMTLGSLCEAAMGYSDNSAANMVLKAIGGPSAVTDFTRSLGDDMTRLDRWETKLNEAIPGDPRDTTTPAAMAADLQALFLGDRLSEESRERLTDWFLGNRTGDARLRAGLPDDWRIGDRTGSGAHGSTNNVAVAWPADGEPVIISAYLTEFEGDMDQRNAAIAEVGKLVARALQQR